MRKNVKIKIVWPKKVFCGCSGRDPERIEKGIKEDPKETLTFRLPSRQRKAEVGIYDDCTGFMRLSQPRREREMMVFSISLVPS